MPRQIVIDLYDHTTSEEIREILATLRSVGIDGARYHDEISDEIRAAADELGIDLDLIR